MDAVDFIFMSWKKEQKVFSKNLVVLKKHPGKDAVHDLRVAVKKLRATLELYFLVSGKKIQDDPLKETEKFFTILGKQRDIEICVEIMESYEKEYRVQYPGLKNYFQSVLSVACAWTKNAVQDYKKKELEEIALVLKNETLNMEEEELKIKITGILHDRLAGCRELFKKPHKLRQQLKEIYYWLKMIPGNLITPAEYEKDLHALLDDFGDWQNLVVFETRLRHFRKDYLPKTLPEYESAKMLENVIHDRKDKLLKMALRKTGSLLRKALEMENAGLKEL